MANESIQQIRIPVRPSELTIEIIEKYLDTVFNKFQNNARRIRRYYDEYCLNHLILNKQRQHKDSEVNNIVVIPNIRSAINWKTGYILGSPIKYAQSKVDSTEAINYLNKYVRNAKQRSVDKDVATWVYATGVGYYFVEPKSKDFNSEYEAPYELYCRESDTCTKVYSSYNGYAPLFDILYTTQEKVINSVSTETVYVLDIYTPNMVYTYEKSTSNWKLERASTRNINKPLPLVEKRANTEGIGIIAMSETIQNAFDTIISNGIDCIEETVNEIYVYKNVTLGKTPEEASDKHQKMKKNGAITLFTQNKDAPADLDTLTPKLNITEAQELASFLNGLFHSIVGVPMEMSDTNSGGTTKQGSEVANGYENAYNRALDDINTFLRADTELLEKIMWICKNTAHSKIRGIEASEIDIKYSLNLTDNIATKAQAFGIFIQYMPPSMALSLTRLSNDAEMQGKEIEEYMKKKAKMAQQTQVQTQNNNNSQE